MITLEPIDVALVILGAIYVGIGLIAYGHYVGYTKGYEQAQEDSRFVAKRFPLKSWSSRVNSRN